MSREATQTIAQPAPVRAVKPPVHQPLLENKPLRDGPGLTAGINRLSPFTPPLIQPKLKIGAPNDKYEQEADRVAEQVMRMPEPMVQRQAEEEEEEEPIQTKPLANTVTPLVQRQPEPEEEEEAEPEWERKSEPEEAYPILESVPTRDAGELGEEEEEAVQTKSISDKSAAVTAGLQSRIQSLKGGGQPLPKSERAFFEPRFGADFSHVRIHNDSTATKMARSINSRAFTIGRDVVFGAGQYSPDTVTGKRLLAHELTHVVQQNRAMPHCSVVQRREKGRLRDYLEKPPIRYKKTHWLKDRINFMVIYSQSILAAKIYQQLIHQYSKLNRIKKSLRPPIPRYPWLRYPVHPKARYQYLVTQFRIAQLRKRLSFLQRVVNILLKQLKGKMLQRVLTEGYGLEEGSNLWRQWYYFRVVTQRSGGKYFLRILMRKGGLKKEIQKYLAHVYMKGLHTETAYFILNEVMPRLAEERSEEQII